MARYDDLSTRSIAYATFVSAVILLVVILLVQALTYNWILGENERKLTTSHYISSDAEIAKQKSKLDGYYQSTVDVFPAPASGSAASEPVTPVKEKRLHIPLKQAQSLILKEFKKPTAAAAGT